MIKSVFSACRHPTFNLLRHSTFSKYYFAERKTPFTATQIDELDQLTTNQQVSKNIGLQRFLQKVYKTTAFSILGSLGTAYALATLPISAAGLMFLAKGGMVGGLVGIIGSAFMKPHIYTVIEQLNNKQKVQILASRNSILRTLLYGMGIISLGLSAAPLIAAANIINPSILPTALGLTVALFGGASMTAYRMKKDSMLSYGKLLGGSLLGLVGLQLVGLASILFVGMNPYAAMMLNTSTYISVGLFTGFIAYDTHLAVKMYEEGNPDHLGAATSFFLDFWNILMSLIRIFSKNSDN